jgi:hypothetical protein
MRQIHERSPHRAVAETQQLLERARRYPDANGVKRDEEEARVALANVIARAVEQRQPGVRESGVGETTGVADAEPSLRARPMVSES